MTVTDSQRAGASDRSDRAFVASPSSRSVSPVPASIPSAWWETDPEFHEWIAAMHRQDEERDQ